MTLMTSTDFEFVTGPVPLNSMRTHSATAYLLDSLTPKQLLSDLVWGASLSRMQVEERSWVSVTFRVAWQRKRIQGIEYG
jgi:hypothetical protein